MSHLVLMERTKVRGSFRDWKINERDGKDEPREGKKVVVISLKDETPSSEGNTRGNIHRG